VMPSTENCHHKYKCKGKTQIHAMER
jgi:hypothetical protein